MHSCPKLNNYSIVVMFSCGSRRVKGASDVQRLALVSG